MSVRSRLGVRLLRVSYWIRSGLPSLLTPDAAVAYNAQVFARHAPYYIDAVGAGLFEEEAELMDRFHVTSGRALCLACGAGREALALARRGLDVLGVDQVPELVAHATELARAGRLSARFVQADFTRFEPPNESHFDVACLLNCAFTYIPGRKRRIDLLTRVHRALRPGGYCMVSYITRRAGEAERRHDALWRRLARLTRNRDWEPGDRIMPDDAFAHYFESDDEVRREAEACGFRLAETIAGESLHLAAFIA